MLVADPALHRREPRPLPSPSTSWHIRAIPAPRSALVQAPVSQPGGRSEAMAPDLPAMESPLGTSLADEIENAYKSPRSGRIFTLMGPNGAGKSRLLRAIKAQLDQKNVPSFYLTSNRPPHIQLSIPALSAEFAPLLEGKKEPWRHIFDALLQPAKIIPGSTKSGKADLKLALGAFLYRAVTDYDNQYEKYKEDLAKYHDNGGGEKPMPPPRLIDAIEAKIERIIGYKTTIEVQSHRTVKTIKMSFSVDGKNVELNDLSDGEKQILIIGFFLMQADQMSFVFLADEPELYLNEARAVELWENLEISFHDAVFLYATHSPSFATRPVVDKAFLIDRKTGVIPLDPMQPLPATVVRDIVGARIQILRNSKPIIFCEDDAHELLIKDLFDDQFHPVKLGGCEAVSRVIASERAWTQTRSRGVSLCELVDRDAQDEREVLDLEAKGVFCLPFYETEAVLLLPEMALFFILEVTGRTITPDAYNSWLVSSAEFYRKAQLAKLEKYLVYRRHSSLSYDFDENNRTLENVTVLPPDKLEEDFIRRANEMLDSINMRDILGILRQIKSKLLYTGVRVEATKKVGKCFPENALHCFRLLRGYKGFREHLLAVESLIELKGKVEAALRR